MSEPENPPGENAPPASDPKGQPEPRTSSDDIRKLIQSETDRVRTEYSKKFREQQQIIDQLKESSMTESQLRKYKEDQLEEKQRALDRKELELVSVDLLREADLPVSLRDFIIGKDADETRHRLATFRTEFQKAVELAVSGKFKAAGREPGKSTKPPAGARKIYTREEIDQISKRSMDRGLPLQERAALAEEIRLAMQEDRIK